MYRFPFSESYGEIRFSMEQTVKYIDRKDIGLLEGWRIVTKEEACLKLEPYRPDSIFFHNVIEGGAKWSNGRPEVNTTFFCPEDPEFNGAVVIDIRGPIYKAAVFWPYKNFSLLIKALKDNYIIDWESKPNIFFGVQLECFGDLEQGMRSLGVDIKHIWTMAIYMMTPEIARSLIVEEPEPGLKVSTLDKKHAALIASKWPPRRQDSVKFMEDMIDIFPTIGIFTKNDNSQPIAWVMKNFHALGMFYIMPEYRRKGYGSFLAKALSKILGENGEYIISMIDEDNAPSRNLFQKVGFTFVNRIKIMSTFTFES
ncbi:hypothetical protein J437_LFUL016404 [Ladona fulva]|uniref:Glycine N-acyltransferase-like protein n=1 Tax=Ladona fulva TaxID=123851 RepID=A0A8K0P924_LADFU|nr:hypothetical protein J437_LFUL016404 [Ladona fulva]